MIGKKQKKMKVCPDDPTPEPTSSITDHGGEEFSLSSTRDSEILRIRSRGTLNSEFFDNLWPMILRENICEIKSRHNRIFQPVQTFDEIWGHSLLGARGFKNYEPPTELRCFQEEKVEEEIKTRREDKCIRVCVPKIPTLPEQVADYQRDTWLGQYHSYRFVTRSRPWYTKMTKYDADFEITEEMLEPIKSEFDKSIVESIQNYNIKLLVIDMGTDIPLKEMEHWLPFCKFVQLLVVCHDKDMARKLRVLGDIFDVLDFEETDESWQKDIDRSIQQAYLHAVEHDYLSNMSEDFVFAFSKARALCKIDSFEVVHKDLNTMEKYFDIDVPVPEKDPCGCDIEVQYQTSSEPEEAEEEKKCYLP